MPYIKGEDYDRAATEPAVPGELNYAITLKAIAYLSDVDLSNVWFYSETLRLCAEYMGRVGLSYTNGNAVMGVLYCAGRELKRRMADNPEADALVAAAIKKLETIQAAIYDDVIAPYEDTKIEENGDVYPAEIL